MVSLAQPADVTTCTLGTGMQQRDVDDEKRGDGERGATAGDTGYILLHR